MMGSKEPMPQSPSFGCPCRKVIRYLRNKSFIAQKSNGPRPEKNLLRIQFMRENTM